MKFSSEVEGMDQLEALKHSLRQQMYRERVIHPLIKQGWKDVTVFAHQKDVVKIGDLTQMILGDAPARMQIVANPFSSSYHFLTLDKGIYSSDVQNPSLKTVALAVCDAVERYTPVEVEVRKLAQNHWVIAAHE